MGSVGDLAAAVRSRREELGLSIVQVAELAGTSRCFVSDLERGKPSIQMDKAMAVVAALRMWIELKAAAPPRARGAGVIAGRPAAAPTPRVALDRAHDDPEAIGCAECGARVRNLARHLATAHSMRTADYRNRWSLGPAYDLRPVIVAERAARRTIARALLRHEGEGVGDEPGPVSPSTSVGTDASRALRTCAGEGGAGTG